MYTLYYMLPYETGTVVKDIQKVTSYLLFTGWVNVNSEENFRDDRNTVELQLSETI